MNGKGKIPKNRFQAIAKKYPLYLAIAGVAVSFIFSLENYAFEKGMVNFNVMDTYIYMRLKCPGRQFYLRRSVAFCPVMKERFL